MLSLLIDKWKLIARVAVAIAFVTAVITLFIPNQYITGIVVYPTSSSSELDNLMGITASLGLNLAMNGNQSFSIPEVLESYSLMKETIYRKWDTNKYDDPVTLLTYWKYDNKTRFNLNPSMWIRRLLAGKKGKAQQDKLLEIRAEELAVKRLRDRITIREDKGTGQIRVFVSLEERGLATDVANYLSGAVSEIITSMNNSMERKNREFIEDRIKEVEADLAAAEMELTQFRESNRSTASSPQLQLEQERLTRNVRIQTEIYLTLRQQYELARIEEVRQSLPIIVLDQARPPALKAKPRRKRIVLIAMFLGALAAAVWVTGREFWRAPRDFFRPVNSKA